MKNKAFFKINIIYFIALTCVAILFVLGSMGIIVSDVLSSILIQIVVMFAIPLLLYSIFFKKNPAETFRDCGFSAISAKAVAISFLLGILLYILNTFIATASQSIIALFGYESIGTRSTVTLNYQLLLREFVLSAVLPGICEEFLHRGILLHANQKHTNPKACLIISSVLFGLTHLNINQFFYATILGLFIGYASLMADSIYPAIIIHFMNNFLSNYFYYGKFLNFPFAKFINHIESLIMSNFLSFILISILSVFVILWAYKILTKQLEQEKIKRKIFKVISQVKMHTLSIEEAQSKINQMNLILKHKQLFEMTKTYTKPNFIDKIFLISSFVLGGLITISSFIWGII